MALVLNEEQQLLKESIHDFLAQKAPIAALRELRDTKDKLGYSPNLWKEMAEMGLSSLTIPEEYGGLNFGYVALGQALEETGRTLTTSPLISSVLLSTTILNTCGTTAQKEQFLPEIAAGNTIVAFAHEERKTHLPNHVETSAQLEGDHYILNGQKTIVLDGHIANHLIVVARTSGGAKDKSGIDLFLVDTKSEGLNGDRTIMVDSKNAAKITFEAVQVPKTNKLALASYDQLIRIYDIACIGISAEMLGLSLECFERTIQYLKERRQFGVSIGSFQALQHRAAKMFIEIELCKSIVIKALTAIDEGLEDLSALASLAKAKLGLTAKLVTNEGVQMHGGIGMTDEVDIGLFLKRARVAQVYLGDYNYHLNRYATLRGY